MFGVDDAIIGSIGGSMVSGLMNNSAAASRQSAAQDFSAEQFAHRYQTSVSDMKKAGLNPMLAYGNMSASAPSSSAASSAGVPDLGASITAARMSSAQVANIAADTENKKAQADLIDAQAMQARASAWQSMDAGNLAKQQTKEIENKLENQYYVNDAERVMAVAKELKSQFDLNVQKGMTEAAARQQMVIMAHKLNAETDLLELDKKAADMWSNLGRGSKELKPIIDVLMHMLMGGRK